MREHTCYNIRKIKEKINMKYDIAIIGSGQAAWNLAFPLAKAGKKICMIEKDLWGGTCPNRGCDPKKLFFNIAKKHYESVQNQKNGGGKISSMDWKSTMQFKKNLINPLSNNLHNSFDHANITTIDGLGYFMGNDLYVNGSRIYADKIVLALGQKPRIPNIKGKEFFNTSYDFFDLESLPKNITIVGGGYIAFEIASFASEFGCQVQIVERGEQPLKNFPSEIVNHLVKHMESRGIKFYFNTQVESITKNSVVTSDGTIYTDYIISAAGREINDGDMNLLDAGIEKDNNGIIVNDFMETSVSNIYAIGDCVSKKIPKLTTTAIFEGTYLSQNIFKNEPNSISYPIIPTSLYTLPQLSMLSTDNREYSRKEYVNLAESNFTYQLNNEPNIPSVIYFNDKNNITNMCILGDESDVIINDMVALMNIKNGKTQDSIIQTFPNVQSIATSFYKNL